MTWITWATGTSSCRSPLVGKSAAEAVEVFFDTYQRVVSCVTPAVLLGRAYHVTQQPHLLTFGVDDGVRLGRRGAIFLVVELRYHLTPSRRSRSWAVEIVGYEYRLRDRAGQDIIAYHWHPIGRSPITYPHLHVGGRTPSVGLSKAHLPTGQVSLAAVVRMAITELGVEPLRPDWREVLDQAEQELSG